MKKRILQSLSILAVNIAIGGLALAAFFFLLRGDPILAAVPAILALPGIILQPLLSPRRTVPRTCLDDGGVRSA